MKIVAYRRVSRRKQAESGLGLEAQESDIQRFARMRDARIIAEYTEVESGRRIERPQLHAALHHAKVTGATLVIAKLDRLSRSASFTLALRDSGVRFVCCDMPEANDLTIGVLAVVAQAEAQAISRRTKDALQIARKRMAETGQRGHHAIKRLGNPNGPAALRRAGKGNKAAVARVRQLAKQRAFDLATVLDDIRAGGAKSLKSIATELNSREMITPRGGKWHPSSVANLLRQLER
ncbi:recombinase family protein [Bradyrhizobium yuanmingense]|uniref:recombinase family protein n=1 Tax=Bradyrhizobium yuanmingense TaxID=108015 RepID=UPI0023B921FA|nr:recombinase family protein [Bradyrhizobium yuanmingense]MDF0585043.1 recombinase family protein [Bradyrhizobium yuanmingense]